MGEANKGRAVRIREGSPWEAQKKKKKKEKEIKGGRRGKGGKRKKKEKEKKTEKKKKEKEEPHVSLERGGALPAAPLPARLLFRPGELRSPALLRGSRGGHRTAGPVLKKRRDGSDGCPHPRIHFGGARKREGGKESPV